MKVLLLSIFKPSKGGIVTHVENLIGHSKAAFEILSYEKTVSTPGLRAMSYVVLGLLRGYGRDFDIIHAHFTLPQGLLGLILKHICQKPLVVTVHGSDITIQSKKEYLRPISKWVLEGADRVVAVSAFLKEEVIKLGVDPSRVEVVYGGVDIPKDATTTSATSPGATITFIGAMVPQKGVDVLLKAFGKVKEKVPEARLVIVGGGPERDGLEAQSAEMGLEDVEFTGLVEDLTDIYRGTAVLALPSREEGFGLVLLEAMARGVPVVAADTGGIPEIVDDRRNGLLVPPGDADALADALLEVLKDDTLRSSLVLEGRTTSESFTWVGMGTRIDALYKEIIGA
jgi:glycosyltransferase involved in cell wall biosynthesis